MGLGDITGVFSRYFVVGFFLPSYISLVSLWLAASSHFIPNVLEQHSQGTELLILGAVALVAGLALSGSSYLITRVFEGYPLAQVIGWPVLGRLARAVRAVQRRSYNRLRGVRDDESKTPEERTLAAWRLEKFFPHEPEDLLPTRLGNAIRAFELHSNVRWGLDGVTIWPRVDALLNSDERELHVDAKIDLYVFVNAALGAFTVGVCLVVDKAVNAPNSALYWPLYAVPFVGGYVLYRAALGPAANWGEVVRASIDLHRLDVYEKLGVRAPLSFSDERQLADRINFALLYGTPPLEDDLWRKESDEEGEQNEGRSAFLPLEVPTRRELNRWVIKRSRHHRSDQNHSVLPNASLPASRATRPYREIPKCPGHLRHQSRLGARAELSSPN